MMKKLLAILLVMASMLLFWACDDESNKIIEETTKQETTEITEAAATEKEEETIDDSLDREDFLITYAHQEKIYQMKLDIEIDRLYSELLDVRQQQHKDAIDFQKKENMLLPLAKKDGFYQAQLDNARQDYKEKVAESSAIEESLEKQLSSLRKEYNNPSYEPILQMIADTEEMTFAEAYRKYQKYIASEEE